MRSRTEDHLPGRCQRCWLKQALCLCERLPRVDLPFEVRLLRHVREGEKSTNTGRLVGLAISRCELFELDPSVGFPSEHARALEGAWLLFPDEPGAPGARPAELPGAVLVLDGTWRQTRRMLRKVPGLATLPRLALPPPVAAPSRLRYSPHPEHMSTLEAVAAAAALLGCSDRAETLRSLHHEFVRRVLLGRGTPAEVLARLSR